MLRDLGVENGFFVVGRSFVNGKAFLAVVLCVCVCVCVCLCVCVF